MGGAGGTGGGSGRGQGHGRGHGRGQRAPAGTHAKGPEGVALATAGTLLASLQAAYRCRPWAGLGWGAVESHRQARGCEPAGRGCERTWPPLPIPHSALPHPSVCPCHCQCGAGLPGAAGWSTPFPGPQGESDPSRGEGIGQAEFQVAVAAGVMARAQETPGHHPSRCPALREGSRKQGPRAGGRSCLTEGCPTGTSAASGLAWGLAR